MQQFHSESQINSVKTKVTYSEWPLGDCRLVYRWDGIPWYPPPEQASQPALAHTCMILSGLVMNLLQGPEEDGSIFPSLCNIFLMAPWRILIMGT